MNKEDKDLLHDLLVTWHGAAIVIPNSKDVLEGRVSNNSIKYVLKNALRDIENDKPLAGLMKSYIVSALKKIVNGSDPSHAFKFKHGSRKKNDAAYERMVALVVYLAINKEGLTTTKAIEQTATNYCKSNETIKKIYYSRKKEVEIMIQWIKDNALGKKDP